MEGQTRKITMGILGILLVGAIIWAIVANTGNSGTGNVTKEGTIKIGFIGPMSGDLASVGQDARSAAELAVDSINANGGINGQKLSLIVEDTKCDASAANSASSKLINIDNVPVIVGGLCSSETLAAAPVAEKSKIVLLSYCSSAPSITQAGDYVFRDYPSDSYQGSYLAQLMVKRGVKKVAILYCLSDYCLGIKETFTKKFTELGGEIVSVQSAEQSATDYRTQLTKIKESNPQGIFLIAYTEGMIEIIKQIRELNVNADLYNTEILADPKILDTVGSAADGIIFTVPTAASTDFQNKLNERLGRNGTSLCAAQTFDAVNIIAEVMKKAGTNSEKIKDELYKVQGYKGASGIISFDVNGDIENVSYDVNIVRNGKIEALK